MDPPPAAEQQTVVRLSAPRATLRLRFPIADLRPERDPWAGQAVRTEQLRLELSEPQFRSELSSGPGPPGPTRLELTCSDLHGKSPRGTAPGAESQASRKGGLGATEGAGSQWGQTQARALPALWGINRAERTLYPWAAAAHGHKGGCRSVNNRGHSPLPPPALGEKWEGQQ